MYTDPHHHTPCAAARIIGALLCLLLFGTAKTAAQSIDSVFANVPMDELPLLEQNPRLDMLDLYNYNMTAKGENLFGRNSVMTEKTENHVVVQLTDVSRWELMRLRADTAVVYACLHTLTAPIGRSRLHVYTDKWEPLDAPVLPAPAPSDFVENPDSLSPKASEVLEKRLKTCGVTARWESEADATVPTLVFEVVLTPLSREAREQIEPYLRPLRYVWNGTGFKREN